MRICLILSAPILLLGVVEAAYNSFQDVTYDIELTPTLLQEAKLACQELRGLLPSEKFHHLKAFDLGR